MLAVIIPAYKPDSHLPELAEHFLALPDARVIVVDDGGGPEYEKTFSSLPEGAVLLRHEVNRGKGAALKTAMAHILSDMPEIDSAVTVDADGQHLPEDVKKVLARLEKDPDALVLGSRAFDGNVPLRSRFGNSLTRQVFAIASGVKVRDTQTGLRAFSRANMANFVGIPGDRYEYEINMLLEAARSGVPIREETIRTVYLDEDNSSSHFNPVKDSIRIYACILKFAMSSLIGYIVDIAFGALFKLFLSTVAANILARCISAPVNFLLNRHVTFKGNETLPRSAAKYAALAACILAVNTLMMWLLVDKLGWNWLASKILVEITLFVVNFAVQGRVVYRARRG